jgi:hypothetical protein
MEDAGVEHAERMAGVPPALRRMHGRRMAGIREQRQQQRGGRLDQLWGPGSQPPEPDK